MPYNLIFATLRVFLKYLSYYFPYLGKLVVLGEPLKGFLLFLVSVSLYSIVFLSKFSLAYLRYVEHLLMHLESSIILTNKALVL